MPWDFSTLCLKYIEVVLARKPINFCYLPIYPYLYIFLQLQMCSSFNTGFVTNNFEYGQSLELLYKCNVNVKLVIMKIPIVKS